MKQTTLDINSSLRKTRKSEFLIEQAQRNLDAAKAKLQKLTRGQRDDLRMESMEQLLHKFLRKTNK
jgi:exonuclease VII small subunit